jgi:hypothetical protein
MDNTNRNDRHQGLAPLRVYPILKSEHFSANTKLTLCKALIRSKMTYACLTELAIDSNIFKLRRLQNKVLLTTGNLLRRTLTRALHLAFEIPYVYDYVTEICREQAEVIKNHEKVIIRTQAKVKPNTRRLKG